MDVKALRFQVMLFKAGDGKITHDEAVKLDEAVKKDGGWTPALKQELKTMLTPGTTNMDPVARGILESAAGEPVSSTSVPLLPTDVLRVFPGSDTADFDDDLVYLGKDGTVVGDTGVRPYSRGYDQLKSGPLRTAHGSPAPESSVLSADQLKTLRDQSPGQSLDKAAAALGAETKFADLAGSHDFYDPTVADWQGHCHGWAWASLNKTIDDKVDVEGPEGQRGVWLAGQWLSRADLGNWVMGLSTNIAFDNEETEIERRAPSEMELAQGITNHPPTPADLVKGMTQYLSATGGGFIADVWNDKKRGDEQIWNQPFYRGEFDVKGLTGSGADKLLAHAEADGVKFPAAVKLLTLTGNYGQEVSDSNEGDPATNSKRWSVYAVTDANGKMLKAYMADDPALAGIDALPTHSSDELPDSIWKGHSAVEAALQGKRHWAIDRDPSRGPMFRFLVHDVLLKGVPATVRTEFEKELSALPPGSVAPQMVLELAKKYPGVANAYAPDQWQQAFASRGLTPDAFGAAWKH